MRSNLGSLATLVGLLAVAVPLAPAGALAAPPASAVVLLYQRFGEDANPGGSVRLDQFEAHVEELRAGGYEVRPLARVMEGLARGAEDPAALPDRTIAITIDDAYLSVHREAWPRLRRAGLPFTVFVSTDSVDRAAPGFMSWEALREMAEAGVTFGTQTASYARLLALSPEEAGREIDRGAARIAEMLGRPPRFFAYPFGEARADLVALVAARGFLAGFGQHSGVVHARMDPQGGLPRFLLNEALGGIERFRLVAGALPLPVADLTPEDPVIGDPNPPAIGFTLDPELGSGTVSCFSSADGRVAVERLEDRIEARLSQPLPRGRSRLNCTMPAPDGRWRWFGMQLVVP